MSDLILGCRMTLTIGKTVLQPIEPTLGNKGPHSQLNFSGGAVYGDDTPDLGSFAEGYEHGKW